MTQKDAENKDPKKENESGAIKPDPETLHTTDPQEHMEGPISSLVQSAKETMEEEDGDDKQEEKKDKKK